MILSGKPRLQTFVYGSYCEAQCAAEPERRSDLAREQGTKPIAQNRKARHDYAIEDKYEAGLVLTGTEVKSLREGRASLAESFITIDRRG